MCVRARVDDRVCCAFVSVRPIADKNAAVNTKQMLYDNLPASKITFQIFRIFATNLVTFKNL